MFARIGYTWKLMGGELRGTEAGSLYLMVLALAHTTLQTIFEAALYIYADKRAALAGFGEDLLAGALVRK